MKKQVLLFAVFLISTVFALGATHYVTPSGAGAMDGTSWTNAYSGDMLQVAIDAAGPNDEVWVAAGTYFTTTTTDRSISFSMRNDVAILGSFAGTEAHLADRDLSNGLTSILSGEIGAAGVGDNSYKVIYNQQLQSTAVLDGFIIELANDDRSPTNSGNGLGGGMCNDGYNVGGFCNPTVRNCVFRDNIASWGAGAFNNGYNNGEASPTYINCVFTNNFALIEAGGMDSYAVNGGTAHPTLINVIFYENSSATNVGAMYAWGGSGGSCQPMLFNCAFVNNSAMNGYGGAFIADNQDQSGGGSSGTCVVTLQNCIVWNNSALGIPEGPQFYIRGTGAQVVATYSDIDMTGQNAPHLISGSGIGNIDADPEFINITSGAGADGIWMTSDDGLQFQGASPCIDMGDNNAVMSVLDLIGNDRIINSTVDLGGYEYVLPSSGIDENDLNLEVKVYPNPTSDVLNLSIQSTSEEDFQLFITDVRGRLVQTVLPTTYADGSVQESIDVSELKAGVYFLTIASSKGRSVNRFVKEM